MGSARVRRSVLVALAVAITAATGGDGALAAPRSRTIRACSNKNTGALRVAARCTRRERRVSW
ncbi:MAG: hypothetical protein ACRDL5_16795, partial [Solirubrobacteraceae bacterium]